ncbi:hypothetical protein B4U80_05133 [Leptotrombidium deliense]|uniref:Uncharacterized protein n=1 Tax=Leptotrombidium deliense TaxID=299467 RepID=A0A443STE2_9ACAR|nr:hypothetical protein B4U80_05133 [Leptotrombidium deliense]
MLMLILVIVQMI